MGLDPLLPSCTGSVMSQGYIARQVLLQLDDNVTGIASFHGYLMLLSKS